MNEMLETKKKSTDKKITIIKSDDNMFSLNLKEIFDSRHLLAAFIKRDYQMRFRQTLVGMAWIMFQPIMYVLVFTLIMNKIGNVSTGEIPYSLYAFLGICTFQLYSKALQEGSNCFITERNIISKIYFPKILLPISSCASSLLDFSIIFLVVLAYSIFLGFMPGLEIVFAPVFIVLTISAALGLTLWLSTVNALYRDVRYIVGFVSQFMMFVTPVFYSLKSIPEKLHILYAINPLVLPIEGIRWAVLNAPISADHYHMLAISGLSNLIILATGLAFFKKMEQRVVDFL